MQDEILTTPIDLALSNLRDTRLKKTNLASQRYVAMKMRAQ